VIGGHRAIKVHLVFPIYDEDARAAEIERLQLLAWGAAHAGCYGPPCRSRTESRCYSRHVSDGLTEEVTS
jgi:hypothetical protein